MAEANEANNGISACTAVDCTYNADERCYAPQIDVEIHEDDEGIHADCETYTQNEHLIEES